MITLQKEKLKTTLLCSALFFMPFICFLTLPISMWRIVNAIFVVMSMLFWKRATPLALLLLAFNAVFLFAISLQTILLMKNIDSYNVIFLIIAVFFVLFNFSLLNLLEIDAPKVVRTMKYSVYFLMAYQAFQIIIYPINPALVTILNDANMIAHGNFFRKIGDVLGFPSLMAESGQLALFLGPMASFMLLENKYSHAKTGLIFFLLVAVSLVMTLSGGAFMEISMFLGLVFLFQIKEKRFALIFVFLGFVAAAVLLIFQLFPAYVDLLAFKFATVFTDSNIRNLGGKEFFKAFLASPFWGMRPGSFKYIDGDPNLFFPVVLADHGSLGMYALALAFVLPMLILFIRSRQKLYAFPIVQMFFHLSLTYGTYIWPFLWIMYVLCFYRLAEGLKIRLPQVKLFRSTESIP